MALYVSKAARRRRAVIVVVAVGVLALVLGLLLGRQQVPSIADRVAGVKADAAQVATGLERLDIEYEQVLSGADDLDTGVLRPFTQLVSQAQETMERAPWLSPAQRSAVVDALAEAQQSAVDGDSLEVFRQHLADAATVVRDTFGVAA